MQFKNILTLLFAGMAAAAIIPDACVDSDNANVKRVPVPLGSRVSRAYNVNKHFANIFSRIFT